MTTQLLKTSTSHYLTSAVAKFYKSPDNYHEENGEVYDFFYTNKYIKLIKDKLEKKVKQNEELEAKLNQKDNIIQSL